MAEREGFYYRRSCYLTVIRAFSLMIPSFYSFSYSPEFRVKRYQWYQPKYREAGGQITFLA